MKKLMMIVATAALLMAPLAASARVAIFVGPRIGWGWYAPYWGPAPYYGYYPYGPAGGELKFDTHDKDAQVYINGAYAGTVKQVKTMHLRPGSYDVEVREQGQAPFDQKVYIAAGKTLHLNPDVPQEQP
jgi:PEGA domain